MNININKYKNNGNKVLTFKRKMLQMLFILIYYKILSDTVDN